MSGSQYNNRREWRVLSLLAPSLKLDPWAPEQPFSVKPDKKLSVYDVMQLTRDKCEGTPFDPARGLQEDVVPLAIEVFLVVHRLVAVELPVVGPALAGRALAILRVEVSGGWRELGELDPVDVPIIVRDLLAPFVGHGDSR